MEFSNLMNSLLTNLIPKKLKVGLVRNLCSKSHISINTRWIPINEGLKFKLDCSESKNSHTLWIDVINFKLRLINFVLLFFKTPSMLCLYHLNSILILST